MSGSGRAVLGVRLNEGRYLRVVERVELLTTHRAGHQVARDMLVVVLQHDPLDYGMTEGSHGNPSLDRKASRRQQVTCAPVLAVLAVLA